MVSSPNDSVPPPKPNSRSVLGVLFNPRLGNTIKPLGESTRIFLHLLASVFATYGLLPRNFPGLRDENAPMTLGSIMGTAWGTLRFNRDGLPKICLFFAVLGVMFFAVFAAGSAFLSMFIGHAHAAAATSEFILPGGTQDIAQAWIDYLFLGTPIPAFTGPAYVGPSGSVLPGGTGTALQGALIQVLAFYSEAMLIIAAMILFYHLTAMIMETAHHGQVMGKRANQMWAPIRLVIAIGLLIPITTGGLNSGQYIVIKMAELGSALATNGWALFLDALTNDPGNVPPMAPVVSQIAADLMSSEACAYDYNARVRYQMGPAPPVGGAPPATNFAGFGLANVNQLLINGSGGADPNVVGIPSIQCPMTISGHQGTKFTFTPGAAAGNSCAVGNAADQDICGWYFMPKVPNNGGTGGTVDAATTGAYALEAQEFNAALPVLTAAATTGNQGIKHLMPQNLGGSAYVAPITIDPTDIDAVITYQIDIARDMVALAATLRGAMAQAVATVRPYGWVLAGALLPMVARAQAMVSNAATAGMPETHPPSIFDPNAHANAAIGHDLAAFLDDREQGRAGAHPAATNFADPRANVAEDMKNFMVLTSKTWAQTQSASGPNAQCAAMIGLQDAAEDGGQGQSSIVNAVFSLVDRIAQMSGMWSEGNGQPCAPGSPGAGLTTFTIGIQQMAGGDPLAEMAALGHANLNAAFNLLGLSVGANATSGIVKQLGDFASSVPVARAVGGIAGNIASAAGTILSFIAVLFMMCGFTLAYILPLFPFTRFFFAVLVWVAALLEAVVAVPLIALAHLNPEGEGLPGNSARHAYFYVFNLMLRPILMIFGLVCGLLLFLVGVMFLNFAYNLAVAASGATAYGHEMMSKVIYTIMYVAIMYISANHSFQLIDHIPEKALSWMGAQAQSMASIGNAQHLANTEQAVSAILQNQLGGTLNTAGQGLFQPGGPTPRVAAPATPVLPGGAAPAAAPGGRMPASPSLRPPHVT